MGTELSNGHATASDIERVLIAGDLSKLNAEQRIGYYKQVCESVGLNPLTQPFNYLNLSGKLVLYATKACTEQLRVIFGVSVDSVEGKLVDDCYVVTASGHNQTGRKDTATGAVSVAGLKGEPKCNALMKAETKAKRRLTLSLCGLGLLDESEVGSIPGAKPVDFDPNADIEVSAEPERPKRAAALAAAAKPLTIDTEQTLELMRLATEAGYCVTDAETGEDTYPELCEKMSVHDLADLAVIHFDAWKRWLEKRLVQQKTETAA